MLKRNDLVKQFELVVQQEIKNHNDQIYAANQSLNSIHNKIDMNKSSQDMINNALGSALTTINEKLTEFSCTFTNILQKIASQASDQRKVNERNAIQYQEIFEAIDLIQKNQKEFASKIRNIADYVRETQEKMQSLTNFLASEMSETHLKVKQDLEKTKSDIYTRPSDISLLRKDLEERIAANRIDVEGIYKEINAFKKLLFIEEKKIENLYTLVDRLKGGKS